jgi:glycosyltransferase involved in cell wall biosynthesis
MKVWLFQTGEPLPSDDGNPRPMRAMNLANALVKKGHSVILWSTGFYHQEKRHRCNEFLKINISEFLEVRLVPSTGYKKNISLSRFFDHCILAWNLKALLKLEDEKPDIGFVGYPPIEAAYVMIKWLSKNNIPTILDIKDKWPHIIVESLPSKIRFLGRFLLFPYYYLAKQTMQDSSGICAHSKGFLDWGLTFTGRNKSLIDFIAPLTSPNDKISSQALDSSLKWWVGRGVKNNKAFKIIFIGSFSRAFNFEELFFAAENLNEINIDCEFILCGDGEKNMELRSKAKKYKNVKIIKWIDRSKIRALAKISDVMIAPYKNTSDLMMSIPNKVIDALMLGLPVLSPLKGEVKYLIDEYNVGNTYYDYSSLCDSIKSLILDKGKLKELSKNAKKLYKSKFEFNQSYSNLVSHLEKIKYP